MSFSVNDKCRKLMDDDRAKAVIEKHLPGFAEDPAMPMRYGMTLKSLSAFPTLGLNADKLEAIEKELSEIE